MGRVRTSLRVRPIKIASHAKPLAAAIWVSRLVKRTCMKLEDDERRLEEGDEEHRDGECPGAC